MACAMVLDPRHDFQAWLSTRGVSSRVAQVVERELGIGDYEALLACAESAQVRSELFLLARERLPFATYAVLRRAIESLASRRQDGGEASRGVDALGLQPFLSGLLDSMVVLLTTVSQELSLSAQKLSSLEPTLRETAVETEETPQRYPMFEPDIALDSAMERKSPNPEYPPVHLLKAGVVKTEPSANGIEEVQANVESTVEVESGGMSAARQTKGILSEQQVHQNGTKRERERRNDVNASLPNDLHSSRSSYQCPPSTSNHETTLDRIPALQDTDLIGWNNLGSSSFEVRSDAFSHCMADPAPLNQANAFWPTSRVSASVLDDRSNAGVAWVLPAPEGVQRGSVNKRRGYGANDKKEKRFRCEECGMRFGHSHTLIRHKRRHTGERPFACQSCGKCFSRSCNLARHRRSNACTSYVDRAYCEAARTLLGAGAMTQPNSVLSQDCG
uniref:uncharacterized protein n=1 Tax=Myxine glutinosa TaxID=7769 RepID=UPI00358F1A46